MNGFPNAKFKDIEEFDFYLSSLARIGSGFSR